MSRKIMRVPLDFDAPLGKTWAGYLPPDDLAAKFTETTCPDCEYGLSPRAQHLHDQWYGKVPFDPASTGSTPFTPTTPGVLAYAERNVASAPDFYGAGRFAVAREARRLATLWNGMWMHHLTQGDVDALVAGGRLMDFTHTWTRGEGWQPKDPAVTPAAAQVNEWSLTGIGHDGINEGIALRARCEREGIDLACPTCNGEGSFEAYPGQRAEAAAWQSTEPPAGDGWQLWQTVTEGGPVSPVVADAEGLARWLVEEAGDLDRCSSVEVARRFVAAGWCPSGATGPDGAMNGPEFAGRI